MGKVWNNFPGFNDCEPTATCAIQGLFVVSMVVVGSGARLTQSGSWICHACARRQRVLLAQGQRRPIHLSYLKKQTEAAKAWQAQATEIREGRKQGMLEILESRGYVGQIAGSVRRVSFSHVQYADWVLETANSSVIL